MVTTVIQTVNTSKRSPSARTNQLTQVVVVASTHCLCSVAAFSPFCASLCASSVAFFAAEVALLLVELLLQGEEKVKRLKGILSQRTTNPEPIKDLKATQPMAAQRVNLSPRATNTKVTLTTGQPFARLHKVKFQARL